MSKKTPVDAVYAENRDMIVDFEFDDSVARVFSDMVRRSVPGYQTTVTMISLLAQQYMLDDSVCYDLGCSLGASTLAIRNRIQSRTQNRTLTQGCRIVAVDNSSAMTQRCRENLAQQESDIPVQIICADLEDIKIHQASVVVLNLTLQFISPQKRLALLQKIHHGLLPGGIVIISEKVRFDSSEEQEFQESMHIAFKKANAYSDLEISQKRQALENVLIPETFEQHKQRLLKAGFNSVYVWSQCFNFVSIIAHKKV